MNHGLQQVKLLRLETCMVRIFTFGEKLFAAWSTAKVLNSKRLKADDSPANLQQISKRSVAG